MLRGYKWNRGQAILVRSCKAALSLAILGAAAQAQDQNPPPPERWNLFYQATSIGQYHGKFPAPYTGPFSLQNYPERDVSLTTTLFFSLRLAPNTVFTLDPE